MRMRDFQIIAYLYARQLTAKHLDERIDTAACEGQRIAPVRMIVALLASLLLAINIDKRSAFIWACFALSSEILSYRVRLALGRNPARPVRKRFTYLLTAALVSLAWSGMPLLYWNNHVLGFEAVSILILTAQLVHAQAFTYRSIPLLIVVGGIPATMLVVLPWLGDTFGSAHFITVNFAAFLAISYVMASVHANRRIAQMLKLAQEELEHFAYYDVLTSLANRRMFTIYLRNLIDISTRQDTRFALLLIDLDRFKDVNDTLGHDAGDALLAEIGARLRRSVRTCDQVARLGGDEFAVILRDTDNTDSVTEVCKQIKDRLSEDVQFNGNQIAVRTSVGVAIFPENGDQEEDLYKSADVALYKAKCSGRNTWRYAASPVGK